MSDLPPPAQSLRTVLSLHAIVAAGILLLVALTGGEAWKALAAAATYFALAGGWSGFKAWRAAREASSRDTSAGRET